MLAFAMTLTASLVINTSSGKTKTCCFKTKTNVFKTKIYIFKTKPKTANGDMKQNCT